MTIRLGLNGVNDQLCIKAIKKKPFNFTNRTRMGLKWFINLKLLANHNKLKKETIIKYPGPRPWNLKHGSENKKSGVIHF